MASNANVLSFQAPPTGGAKHQDAQALLSGLRGIMVRTLVPALQEMFAAADDSLFKMAERAANNAEQSQLFEAMRSLRLKRKEIERSFIQQSALNVMQLGKAPSLTRTPAEFTDKPLSLLENDELEQAVAFDAMQSKVLGLHAQEVCKLTLRLTAISHQRLVDEQNPFGPNALCQSIAHATQALGFNIELKLVLFKLFEQHVLGQSAQLFEQANGLLVEAGILPNLTAQPPKAHANSNPSTSEPTHNAFSVLQELLSQARPAQAPRTGVPIAEADLLRLLSHLQQHAPSQASDLGQQVNQLVGRLNAKTGAERVVEQNDADVINLVSMLFEFILDDRTLPDALNALIGRLQIPILKVALLDKSFFTHSNHPARRLLNEMACAALGMGGQVEPQHDSIYLAIEHVVQRVLAEFVDDVSLFDELLTYFVNVTQAQRRRSALLEQRLRDAELGRAKAEHARLAVAALLEECLANYRVSAGKRAFIEQGLSRVLTLSFLKHGQDSADFAAHQGLLTALLDTEQPDAPLLKALISALDQAGVAAFTRRELLELLAQADDAIPVCVDECRAQVIEPNLPEAEPAPSFDAAVSALPEPIAATELDEPTLSAEALAWAQNLRVGSWVEVLQEPSSKLRCKLAAIVKVTGRYVFVNRSGIKVLEHTEQSLAQAYAKDQVRLLDDALLFDRALESVIDNLRQLKHN